MIEKSVIHKNHSILLDFFDKIELESILGRISMHIKNELYNATKGSSLFNYCLFNKNQNDHDKNHFLSLLSQALMHGKWFDVSKFLSLGERPIDKASTQVAFADKKIKEEEFRTLHQIFTTDEIITLIKIIKELKSYGVISIKELMDEHRNFPQKTKRASRKKGAFLNFFS